MSSKNPFSPDSQSASQCQHVNRRGRRCRMLTSGQQDSLCPYHHNQRTAEARKHDEALAAELLGPIEDFSSPFFVNYFLGNLLKQLVHKRIRRRDALAQAYLCQLLLNTFPAMQREVETYRGTDVMQLTLDTIAKTRQEATASPGQVEPLKEPIPPQTLSPVAASVNSAAAP